MHLSHKIRLPVLVEAIKVIEYEDLDAVTYQEAAAQVLSQEARQQHTKKPATAPEVGDLVVIKNLSLVVCSPPGSLTLTSVLGIPI